MDANLLDRLLSDKTLTYAEIGRRLGVSREWIRQLAYDHPSGSSKDRRDARRDKRLSFLSTIPPTDPNLRFVWDLAKDLGFKVHRLVHKWCDGQYYILTDALDINGFHCRMCVVHAAYSPSGAHQRYARLNARAPEKSNFYIVLTQTYTYVIDSSVIPEKVIFLPLDDCPVYKNNLPKIDWKVYRDAWHLLAKGRRDG